MKNLFLLIILFMSYNVISQDIIIKIDSTPIQSKVLEVDLDLVKYKRYDNLEGPTYFISKSQISVIQYENGTRDIFNQTLSTTVSPNNQIVLLKDTSRIQHYLFLNSGIRIGLSQSQSESMKGYLGGTYKIYKQYTSIGFSFGLDLELGGVFYFAPKKMPSFFGVGINTTVLNTGVLLIGTPGYGALMAPYSASLGPQLSFQIARKTIIDAYFKPGISLVNIDYKYMPAFLMEFGLSARYHAFMIGICGNIITTIYGRYHDIYETETIKPSDNIPYDYTHIRVRVGIDLVLKDKK